MQLRKQTKLTLSNVILVSITGILITLICSGNATSETDNVLKTKMHISELRNEERLNSVVEASSTAKDSLKQKMLMQGLTVQMKGNASE